MLFIDDVKFIFRIWWILQNPSCAKRSRFHNKHRTGTADCCSSWQYVSMHKNMCHYWWFGIQKFVDMQWKLFLWASLVFTFFYIFLMLWLLFFSEARLCVKKKKNQKSQKQWLECSPSLSATSYSGERLGVSLWPAGSWSWVCPSGWLRIYKVNVSHSSACCTFCSSKIDARKFIKTLLWIMGTQKQNRDQLWPTSQI